MESHHTQKPMASAWRSLPQVSISEHHGGYGKGHPSSDTEFIQRETETKPKARLTEE